MYVTKFNDIYFVEENVAAERIVTSVEISIGGFYSQCKTLDDVKQILSMQAKEVGANAVINFKYGQKSKIFSLDQVKFYGSGVAAILSDDVIKKINGQ